jgi:hypothetical protein
MHVGYEKFRPYRLENAVKKKPPSSTNCKGIGLGKLAQAAMFPTFIQEVPRLDLGQEACCPEVSYSFLQYLKLNHGINP